jgi:hypothetical protein
VANQSDTTGLLMTNQPAQSRTKLAPRSRTATRRKPPLISKPPAQSESSPIMKNHNRLSPESAARYRGNPAAEGMRAAKMDARRDRLGYEPPTEDTLFWMVLKPTSESVLGDILFPCDWDRLQLQFLGGLKPSEIYDSYKHETQAVNVAESLLAVRDGKLAASMIR